jgi:hypothetical protein
LPQETKRGPGDGRRLQGPAECILYVQAFPAQHAHEDPRDEGLLEQTQSKTKHRMNTSVL